MEGFIKPKSSTLLACLSLVICLDIFSMQSYSDTLGNVEAQMAEYMNDEYGFKCTGTSHEAHEKIDLLGLEFVVPYRASIEDAEKLIFTAREKYLSLINENKELKPFLSKYPFRNAQIMLKFDSGFSWILPGAVQRASTYINPMNHLEEVAYYYNHLPRSNEFFLVGTEDKKVEPYPSLGDGEKVQRCVRDHHVFEGESEIDAFFDDMRKISKKNRGLTLSDAEIIGTEKIERISFLFIKFGRANREEARKDLVLLSQKIIKNINSNQTLKPFLAHFPFQSCDVSVTLAYRNERFGGHYDGSVHQVIQNDGVVTFYATPDMDHDDFFEKGVSPEVYCLGSETLEDARLLVSEQYQAQIAKQDGLFRWWKRLWE